jgi:hypothetical protein
MARSLKARIADMTDAFLVCRAAHNHAMEEFAATDERPAPFGYRLSYQCINCTTIRHDLRSFRGELLSRRYIWPEGYKMAGTGRAVPTKLFYAEIIRRRRSEDTSKVVKSIRTKQVARKTRPLKLVKEA